MQSNNKGIFTISLDLELFWGVRDVCSLENYEANIKGEYQAVPALLNVFKQYGIHVTWATVGFLFHKNAEELVKNLPSLLPSYQNKAFCPYQYLVEHAATLNTKYHFAPELIKQIKAVEGQEIGTHTFSHYYCLEAGQNKAQFEADICKAHQLAQTFEIQLKSIVFPRNQYNKEYLSILCPYGIKAYRGNQNNWLYKASPTMSSKIKRLLRLTDAYINLTGYHCHSLNKLLKDDLVNIPASRFLRPYLPRLKNFEKLRLHRIKAALLHAAKKGKLFHLWWHPHNFGTYLSENMAFLLEIINFYKELESNYGMRCLNMSEVYDYVTIKNLKKW